MMDLRGRRVLVVGGGGVARRKVDDLVAAGARVEVVAPEIDPGIERPGVVVRRRPWRPGDTEGAWLVVTATGDPTVDRAVFVEAERRRIFCNAADDPAHCSVTLPAVLRRPPVVVAVGTAGTSPALAAWLRDRIAGAVPGNVGQLAAILAEARERLRRAGRPTGHPGWRAALDGGMLEHLDAGDPEAARALLERSLGAEPPSGEATPAGDRDRS